MFPAILDLSALNVAVIGNGAAAVRRVHLLEEAGARRLRVFSVAPDDDLAGVSGRRLARRFPTEREIAAFHVVFTADLPEADARRFASWARKHGTLINTEDFPPLCDFHVPSIMRRGELLLTVSTGGKSPGLARRLRRELETVLGPEWADRLEELSKARHGWRAEGLTLNEVAQRTDALVSGKGWL